MFYVHTFALRRDDSPPIPWRPLVIAASVFLFSIPAKLWKEFSEGPGILFGQRCWKWSGKAASSFLISARYGGKGTLLFLPFLAELLLPTDHLLNIGETDTYIFNVVLRKFFYICASGDVFYSELRVLRTVVSCKIDLLVSRYDTKLQRTSDDNKQETAATNRINGNNYCSRGIEIWEAIMQLCFNYLGYLRVSDGISRLV